MKVPAGLGIFSVLWISLFWGGCVAIPLGFILASALGANSSVALTDPVVLAVALTTLKQAVWSTFFSGFFGLFLGEWLGRYLGSRVRSRMLTLFTIPYGVPTVVAGMAWVVCLGRAGWLAKIGIHSDWAYSLKAVILAHSFFNIPWVALIVAQTRRFLPVDQLEAARTLGAGPFSIFRFVIWPHIRWSFASACAQVMSLCAMSFALVLILGGGPPVQTLETELYARLRYGSLDMGGAVSCAFWQLLITLAPWALVLVFKSKQPALISLSSTRRPKKSSGGLGLLLAMTGMFFLIPYFAVINSQLIKIISVGEWREQISAPLRLSLALAFYSSLGAVATAFLGVLSLRAMKRWPVLKSMTEILIGIPGGISVLVLSLGVWLAYGKWFDPFEGSFLAMVALQTTLFFPVAFRIFWPLSQSLRLRELEAAVSLGASEFSAFWWVEFPRWRGPILSALAAVAGASLGEVGAVSLFYSEKLIPLPLLVSRWMEQYHFEEAQGIAGLLFLLSSFLIVGSLEAGNKFSTS